MNRTTKLATSGTGPSVDLLIEGAADFQVWLNTEHGSFDGTIIGVGTTAETAVAESVLTLVELTNQLRKYS